MPPLSLLRTSSAPPDIKTPFRRWWHHRSRNSGRRCREEPRNLMTTAYGQWSSSILSSRLRGVRERALLKCDFLWVSKNSKMRKGLPWLTSSSRILFLSIRPSRKKNVRSLRGSGRWSWRQRRSNALHPCPRRMWCLLLWPKLPRNTLSTPTQKWASSKLNRQSNLISSFCEHASEPWMNTSKPST